jgi:hypothetical protein
MTPSSSASWAHDPFVLGLLGLEVVGRHLLAGATVDDHCLVDPQALGRARDVHRRVAAAIDDDPPAKLRRLGAGFHLAQHRDRIEDLAGGMGRYGGALRQMGADRDEDGVEALLAEGRFDVLHLAVQLQRHAHFHDPRDLRIEDVARQAIFWNAEAHHAAGHWTRLAKGHLMAKASQVVSRGKAARPRADDQHPLAARHGLESRGEAFLDGVVAEKALDGVNADGLVQLAPVAAFLAGVVADAAHDGRQRIVFHQSLPGRGIVATFGVIEPLLDVLAGRTGVVAGRQAIHIVGPQRAPGSGLIGETGAGIEGDGERQVRLGHGRFSSANRP